MMTSDFESSVLLSLPIELLWNLLDHAGPLEVARFQMTCRTLRDVVKAKAHLQYRIKLCAYCKIDDSKSNESHTRRLSILRQREEAWRDRRSYHSDRIKVKVDLPLPIGGFYFSEGIVHLSEFVDGQFANTHGALVVLPSSNDPRDLEERHWSKYSVDFWVDTAAFDASQDLLALLHIEMGQGTIYTVHLRTLSTRLHHPCALIPKLVVEMFYRSYAVAPDNSLEIAGDHIGFSAGHATGCSIFIWNWRTGSAKEIVFNGTRMWTSFAFLREDAILICDKAASGSLEVYTLSSSTDSFRHAASFHLPTIHTTFMLANIHLVREEPLIRRQPAAHQTANTPIYRSDPDKSILAITLYYWRGKTSRGGSTFATLVVDKAVLLSGDGHPTSRGFPRQATMVPWDEWGSKNTRMFPDVPYVPMSSVICGVRFAQLEQSSFPGERRLKVYDFSRYWPDPSSPDAGIEIVRTETVTGEELFVQPVRTALPYSVLSTDAIFNWTVIWMDEERIIGLTDGYKDGIPSLSVLLVTPQ